MAPTVVKLSEAELARMRVRSLGYLAPKMREAAVAMVERLEGEGLDPLIFETLRLPALQAEYFRKGASRQQDVLHSMHGHGLAFDIISIKSGWNDPAFFIAAERVGLALGLTAGRKWKNPNDPPHFQWGSVPGAVPDSLIVAFNRRGIIGSWTEVGAM